LPAWLHFLRTPEFSVALWVKIVCSFTMAMGTAAGGWRIIRTLGHRMVRLQPIHGFAAETAAAGVIQAASAFGVPLSTTHVISASIMGVGASRRFNAVKWSVVGRMAWAWVLTLPTTAMLGYGLYHLFHQV
jgi:PiT family inorganic phosphate transporter